MENSQLKIETLVEAALMVLNTADVDEKARITDEFAVKWFDGVITLPYVSSQEYVIPDRPARLSNDIIARFGKQEAMPTEFFTDFVKVAQDEARHYRLLAERLTELGSSYGALPAHDGLWDSAIVTSKDLLSRLAVEHCVHEARGLDVLPTTISRFRRAGDNQTADLLEKVIYPEEITHCAAGIKWFKYLCWRSGKPTSPFSGGSVFQDVWDSETNDIDEKGMRLSESFIQQLDFRGPLKPPFIEAARKAAGFDPSWYEPLAVKEAAAAALLD